MVGVITNTTALNSFWSISFCVLALTLHGYATYLAALRHQGAAARLWPSKGPGPPGEVACHLGLLVLSCLLLPPFALFSVLRVGNYANDGVKLGRDHALNPNLDAWCRGVRSPTARRLWRGCVPLAPTLFLAAAFLLLLPETLLTAVEVDYGYKTSDTAWSTDVDFLFPEARAHTSDLVSSINFTNTVANGSRVVIPTPHPPPGGWGSDHSLSLSFVNFALALLTFGVRYASVFWYTSKALSLVLGVWLLILSLTAALGYSAFACLYKVCRTQQLYPNVRLALGCQAHLGLYLTGSAIMLLSTTTIFQYGAHYFAEKMRIIERKHQRSQSESGSEESLAQHHTVVVHSGCQGYAPHSLAMAALVLLAACKGPVLYDLMALYRLTADPLLLAGLVVEVGYLVLWIGLWFGLTVKQRWQFRILDYVPLGQPLFMIQEDQIMKNPCTFEHNIHGGGGDCNALHLREVVRAELGTYQEGGEGAVRLTLHHDRNPSEAGTEDTDSANLHAAALEGPESDDGAARMARGEAGRRPGGPRVTFDDHTQHSGRRDSTTDADTAGSRHVNVRVDVHNSHKHAAPTVPASGVDSRAASNGVVLRRQNSGAENMLTREYRNSIRSKCDDFYAVVDHGGPLGVSEELNNLSPQPADPSPATGGREQEPLQTLMSSFRDKVKESSRTASSYREQRRHLQQEAYGSLERQQQPDYGSGLMRPLSSDGSLRELQSGVKRRGVVEAQVGDISLRLDDSLDSGVRSGQRNSTLSASEDDPHSLSFQQATHGAKPPQCERAADSTGLQPAGSGASNGLVASKTPRQAAGMDYLSIDKAAVSGYPRSLHVVAGRGGKVEIGRRDSANYSLTSSQETSSNDSDQGLCSQNGSAPK